MWSKSLQKRLLGCQGPLRGTVFVASPSDLRPLQPAGYSRQEGEKGNMTLSYLQQGWGTFDQAHASIFQVSEELYTFTFIVVNLIPIVEESRSRGDTRVQAPEATGSGPLCVSP